MSAAALLPPARFLLPTVDEGLHPRDRRQRDDWHVDASGVLTSGPRPPQHHYLDPLIWAQRCFAKGDWRGQHRRLTVSERELGVSSPESVASPRLHSRRGGSRHQRSRSEPFSYVSGRMAAVVEDKEGEAENVAPSSPPDLSYSKSSQSSSSSGDEEDDDQKSYTSTEKLGRFDDKSRESVDDSNLRPESRPTLRRPPPRSATMSETGRKVLSPPLHGKENRYPSLKGAVNGVLRDQSLNLPSSRGVRRTFTTPASPSYPLRSPHAMSSRSPSPTKPILHHGSAVSPRAGFSHSSPRLPLEPPSPNIAGSGPFGRRKSWQPGRKTVKQLEAEYDDFDEEVPEEAILENVPISPMPGQSRLSPHPSPRPSRSTTPSPHRRASHATLPSVPSHTNLHSANVPKNAKRPRPPPVGPNGQYGSPSSPRHPRPPPLQHAATMPLGDALNRRLRSKSWTEDLNDEARALSAALEEYEDRKSVERSRSGANSVSSSPPRPSYAVQRSKTMIMDMPPLSYGHIHIDPLPVSKEKEAVLSKTRPSWLPPKDLKESKKHMKEWEHMMARAAENEKKRQMKEREAQEDSEELKDGMAKIWEQHVLPNWDTVIAEPRTRELWWRGAPPNSRGLIWQKAIGNELRLSTDSFEAALKRANDLEEKFAQLSVEERSDNSEASWFSAIARDVPLTCPEITEPTKRTPFEYALSDVLKAYAIHRREVGYVYGTHLVAGLLCSHLRPADAFIALANLHNRLMPQAFFTHDVEAMQRAYDLVLSTLKYKFPQLHAHLTSPTLGLQPEEYLDPMFHTLFAWRLSPALLSRVWDVIAFEGDKVLVRTAVAILGRLESRLYGSKEEVLALLGWDNLKGVDLGPEEKFMTAVRDAGKVEREGENVQTVYV